MPRLTCPERAAGELPFPPDDVIAVGGDNSDDGAVPGAVKGDDVKLPAARGVMCGVEESWLLEPPPDVGGEVTVEAIVAVEGVKPVISPPPATKAPMVVY